MRKCVYRKPLRLEKGFKVKKNAKKPTFKGYWGCIMRKNVFLKASLAKKSGQN